MANYYSTERLEEINESYQNELSTLQRKYEKLFNEEIEKQLRSTDSFYCGMGSISIEPERSSQDDFINFLTCLGDGDLNKDFIQFCFENIEPTANLNEGYVYVDHDSFLIDGQKYYIDDFEFNNRFVSYGKMHSDVNAHCQLIFYVLNDDGKLFEVQIIGGKGIVLQQVSVTDVSKIMCEFQDTHFDNILPYWAKNITIKTI